MDRSAIHVKLVWRFLVRHRQDLLGEFLEPEDDVPGIFLPGWEDDDGSSSDESESDIFSDDEEVAFLLPAIYGLRRLLQPQAAILARRWRDQAVDQTISSSDRTKAVARYCSSPATSFRDVVETVDELWKTQRPSSVSPRQPARPRPPPPPQ